MFNSRRVYSELTKLPENEREALLDKAREDAYRIEGKRRVKIKWIAAQASALAVCSFFAGFVIAAAYYALTSSRPDAYASLTIGALTALAVVGSWPAMKRRLEVCLLASQVSSRAFENRPENGM